MKSVKILLCLTFLFHFLLLCSSQSCDPVYPYRQIDGTCNNIANPLLGAAGQPYRRGPEGQYYGPDFSWPVGDIPNERVLSNTIVRGDPSLENSFKTNMLFTQFLQFMTHDLDHNEEFDYYTSYTYNLFFGTVYPNDPVDTTDPACQLYPFNGYNCDFSAPVINACITNNITGPAQRPIAEDKSSTFVDVGGIRNILNGANSFLDLAPIYSNIPSQLALLRSFQGGHMLTDNYTNVVTQCAFFEFPGVSNLETLCTFTSPINCTDCLPSYLQTNSSVNLPPTMNPKLSYLGLSPEKIWVSGDPRVTSNIVIATIHLLFIRHHNTLADLFAELNPTWNDETLFQEARRWNIAQYQSIVYGQALPLILGPLMRQFPTYSGYNAELDPTNALVFGTGAFRAYGHTIVKNFASVDTCGNNFILGQVVPEGTDLLFAGQSGGFVLPLDTYAEVVTFENGIRGAIAGINAPVDIEVDDILRNILFLCVNAGVTDLFAIDTNRARQNGVPPYYTLRRYYSSQPDIYGTTGCPAYLETSSENDPLACFTGLVPHNSSLATNLWKLYGKLIYIDAEPGMLVEPIPSGNTVPPTIAGIVMDTFLRMRDGDRFWFQNVNQPKPFSALERLLIRGTTFGQLLREHFDFGDDERQQVPDNPFTVPRGYIEYLREACH
jgi:hypothetical protein